MILTADQLKQIIQEEHHRALTEKKRRVSAKGRKDMSRAQKKLVEEVTYKGKRAKATHSTLFMLGFRQRGNNTWSGPSKRTALERNFTRALERLKKAEGVRGAAAMLMDAKVVGLVLTNRVNWMGDDDHKK